MKTVLLTGATGFLGAQTARYLLRERDVLVLALVRANNVQEAKRRLLRNWWDWPELVAAVDSRVDVVCGDVGQPNFGVNPEMYKALASKVTHIIHAAADWRLVSLEQLRETNVQGTAHVLEFAKAANRQGQFKRLSHISTAYVAGGRTGTVLEGDLTDKYGFLTDYERSKYEAEQLVTASKTELPVSVFRPPMIVGDSETGAIKTFNTIYFPLRLYLTGKMWVMPVKRSLKINIAPVDYVAQAVVKLTFEPKAAGLNFHLVASHESLPTVEALLEEVRKWAKTNLGTALPKPVYVGMSPSTMKRLMRFQGAFKGGRSSDVLTVLAPYFSEKRHFDRSNVDRFLGQYDFKWQQMLPRMLQYATYYSFFHRSERTVHEQVVFRLESQSYPVTYYDVVEGQIVKKSAQKMHNDILAVAAALRFFGVEPGDRVALTGLNCTRYLAIDIAIGLVGAVSVPLYYTSPPPDIDQVLRASGAKLLFVGIPSLLNRVSELRTDLPIVSFCRNTPPKNSGKTVIEWADFLAKSSTAPLPALPVDFGDIATLRYSSGTTGKPKGAIFLHQNLCYMAESIASITPWQTRSRKSSYLSFLPMGHVVEGILATYTPYYIPAPIEIYFLEDFRKLQDALPMVRPTIFFSVPRIYEKIWENLEKNWLGKIYVDMKPGLLKRLLGRVVRGAMLKRAGLNRCKQLIVGSVSSDVKLLEKFRELEVEIYDAYGLTEAPLVTLNRLGRNRLGTVGEPMPFTQVKTNEEGEIMVKGPQVTVGYFDKTLEVPLKDGWLMTGDLGKVTEEDSLIIYGRKKEVIKTSYGKCIYSGKIEGLLKEISSVAEALLVGECKPYCGALLWVHKEQWNEATAKQIDAAIEEMNKHLSNPEKVKRWALFENTLTVENGDLTPNLKLKRNVMTERYAQAIDALYGGVAPKEAHVGGVEKPE